MVETKVKKAPAAAAKGAGKGKVSKSRLNQQITSGVYRYGPGRNFHKKGLWKFIGKKTDKQVKPKKPLTVTKTIGGDKNGGTRVVLVKKRTSSYPTTNRVNKHSTKNCFSQHKRYTRKTLTPGTVLILLAGRHKGKRVVLMKVLKSGLLLVNGPFKLNACPLRRIHQNYVIATSTKIDISGVSIPEKINDDYFRRIRQKRAKKEEGEIFAKKTERYTPSEERKKDQVEVDKQVIAAIKKHSEKKLLFIYLRTLFGLRNQQYPHRMKF